MIPFEEAFEIVISNVSTMANERVELNKALGRVLVEDVVSDIDMPPFNRSTMDGYACHQADLENELNVLETIPAGSAPTKPVGKNECSKIMTGAPVPEGADCVIMVEFTEECGENSIRFKGKGTQSNICLQGEDVKTGDVVINGGSLITERHMAVLAAVGQVQPLVACRPTVGIIATGNELVEPCVKPGSSQIRNSNAYQLRAQLEQMGVTSTYYGIAEDGIEPLTELITKASEEKDVVLVSGGVSMGDYDFVPKVLSSLGFELVFDKIAIKPGKPTVFAKTDSCFCFGMPGNPVSTFVLFEMLVKPFLYKMMGHDYKPLIVTAKLSSTVSRKKTGRASWIPVAFKNESTVDPLVYHGSAHISALHEADGMICLPVGVAELKEGADVAVRQI